MPATFMVVGMFFKGMATAIVIGVGKISLDVHFVVLVHCSQDINVER